MAVAVAAVAPSACGFGDEGLRTLRSSLKRGERRRRRRRRRTPSTSAGMPRARVRARFSLAALFSAAIRLASEVCGGGDGGGTGDGEGGGEGGGGGGGGGDGGGGKPPRTRHSTGPDGGATADGIVIAPPIASHALANAVRLSPGDDWSALIGCEAWQMGRPSTLPVTRPPTCLQAAVNVARSHEHCRAPWHGMCHEATPKTRQIGSNGGGPGE